MNFRKAVGAVCVSLGLMMSAASANASGVEVFLLGGLKFPAVALKSEHVVEYSYVTTEGFDLPDGSGAGSKEVTKNASRQLNIAVNRAGAFSGGSVTVGGACLFGDLFSVGAELDYGRSKYVLAGSVDGLEGVTAERSHVGAYAMLGVELGSGPISAAIKGGVGVARGVSGRTDFIGLSFTDPAVVIAGYYQEKSGLEFRAKARAEMRFGLGDGGTSLGLYAQVTQGFGSADYVVYDLPTVTKASSDASKLAITKLQVKQSHVTEVSAGLALIVNA